MKYTYAYKTSDGVRHEAAMDAASREAVFEALRAQGIRAIKVVAADGSKANGAERDSKRTTASGGGGKPKSGRAALVAAVALAAIAGGAWWQFGGGGRGVTALPSDETQSPGDEAKATSFLTAQTRRQVIGDVAVIEKGIRTGWADAFEREGDRFFASFAIPGAEAGQRSTSEDELRSVLEAAVEAKPDDPLEIRQIKAMVEGMKEEARRYIAAGGTAVGYGQRLVERQEAEIAIYGRVKSDIEAAHKKMDSSAFEDYLEKRNDELRNLGIKPVVISE